MEELYNILQIKPTHNNDIVFNPSICIPRIYDEVTEDDIINAFNKLNIGNIDNIFIKHNPKYNTNFIIIHFKNWFNNDTANFIKDKICNDNGFKLVHKFPNYWKCFLAT